MKKYVSLVLLLAVFLGATPAYAATPTTIESLQAQIAALTAELTRLVAQKNSAAAIEAAGTSSAGFGSIAAALTATPTGTTPTAPFLLTGNFKPFTGKGAAACFQIRTAAASYTADCTSPVQFSPVGSTVVGAQTFALPLSFTTAALQPGTTYFFRVSMKDVSLGSQFFSNEVSFSTPAAPAPVVAPVVTPVTKPVTPPVVTTPVVTTSSAVVTITPAATGTIVVSNVPNQTLGTFSVTTTGEPVTVKGVTFHTNLTTDSAPGAGDTDLVTNVTLVAANGSIVAGPVDATLGKAEGLLVFKDTIRIPVGTITVSLKGRVRATAGNGQKIRIGMTPSLDWATPVGLTSGKKVNLPTKEILISTPTIKAPSLTLKTVSVSGVSSNPLPLFAGTNSRLFQVYSFDATQSGEDIRFSSAKLLLDVEAGASQTMLTNCQLQLGGDKGLLLNTGSNVVNPTASEKSGTQNTFTFDKALVVPKGQAVTAQLMCNVSASAKGSFAWGLNEGSSLVATGAQSANNVPVKIVPGLGAAALVTTVRPASLSVSVASDPVSQTIVPGGTAVLFAKIQLDTTSSGEDVRISNIPLILSANATSSAKTTSLTNCQLFDGNVSLMNGSNILNPQDTDIQKAVFDQALTVQKGIVKILSLKCTVSASAKGSYSFSVFTGVNGIVATGVTTSSTAAVTITTGNSPVMTVSQSSLSFSTDASSPQFQIAQGGQTNVVVGVVKFRATGEAMNLQRMGLALPSGSPQSVSQVKLFDGSTQVGTAVFTGNNRFATSTFNTPVTLPRDTDKTITIKADFAQISSTGPATPGDVLAFGVTGAINTQAVGVSSGTVIAGFGSTSFSSISLQKSTPVVTLDSLPGTNMEDGRLVRFRVDANLAGDISLGQFAFQIARSNATIQDLKLFAFTDAGYSAPVSGNGISNGLVFSLSGVPAVPPTNVLAKLAPVVVPAGQARFFELRATVVPTGFGAVTVSLVPDDGGAALKTFASYPNAGFVWSPNSTRSSQFTDADWVTGFGVANFTVGNGFMTQTRTGTGSPAATNNNTNSTSQTGASSSSTTTTTSSTTAVPNAPVTLTVATSLTAGATTNVSWSITKATTPKDWIAFAPTGGNWTTGTGWFYTAGAAQGQKQISVPAIAGTYDVVYYVNDGQTEVGRTKGVVVNSSGVTHTLSLARTIDDGQTSVGIQWSVPGGVKEGDWIGFAPVGQTWKDPLPWIFVNGQKQTSGTIGVPKTAGQYQLVYFEKGMIEKARSSQIFVKQ